MGCIQPKLLSYAMLILPEHSRATAQSSHLVHRQSGRHHRDSRLSRTPRMHDLPGFAAASTDGSPTPRWGGELIIHLITLHTEIQRFCSDR